VWLELHVEGIDCADCVADLKWMSKREPGVLKVELDLKGRLRALVRADRVRESELAIRRHVKSYGFKTRALKR